MNTENENIKILPDEGILQSSLYGLVDFSRPVFYFPIRHHSPVCSYFLLKTIEKYKPDCILIEGPEDANELADVLVSEELEAPVAIYYSFKDGKGVIRAEEGDPEDYRCYYPFLDYSPELLALREAKRLGIPASFFDLGYAEILLATAEGRGLRKEQEKVNYNDDSYLSESIFMKGLVEKAGLRNFDEFWEKYFEIEGLSENTEDFIKTMLLYCGLCRASSGVAELMADGCLAREAHMRENIRSACEKYRKVLVVTGGFHTPGLAFKEEIAGLNDSQKTGLTYRHHSKTETEDVFEGSESDKKKAKLKSILPKEDKGVYIMSYSMEAADALNGYASGMPHPAFYQSVWEALTKTDSHLSAASERGKHDFSEMPVKGVKPGTSESGNYDSSEMQVKGGKPGTLEMSPENAFYSEKLGPAVSASERAYPSVVLDCLVKVGKNVRKKDGATSTADEIAALNMAVNLAKLRGKNVPGAFELSDSVLSSFVKGEMSLASNLPMTELRKVLTGKKIGKLPKSAKLPPLVTDFEEKCRSFRLDIHSTTKKEATLQIFANEKHRKESAFFHSMVFLESGFASRKRGPNLHTGADRNLIRETWEYKWNTALTGVLIENSVYGGTIEEACFSLVRKKAAAAKDSAEAAGLLLSAFEMGFDIYGDFIKKLTEIVQSDSDFFSLTAAFASVNMLDRLSSLYRNSVELTELRDSLFGKLLSLLPGMAELKDEDLEKTLSAVRELYYEAGRLQLSAKPANINGSGKTAENEKNFVTQSPSSMTDERQNAVTEETSAETESGQDLGTEETSAETESGQNAGTEKATGGTSEKMEYLLSTLSLMNKNDKIHPGLLGAVQGILYSAGALSGDEVCLTAKGFMNGTDEKRRHSASYLRGLFYTARDLIFSSNELIDMLDSFLGEVEKEDFLRLLPQLRLAFSSFTPRETDRIAEKVAKKHGIKTENLLGGTVISAECFDYGRKLENRILGFLK